MAQELGKFYDEYSNLMTIRSLSLSNNSAGVGDFPVSVVPTQFFYNADGTPYMPRNFALTQGFELVKDASGNHIFTKHSGLLSYDVMVSVYDDIANQ
jgi:thioredoxin 1